jgi:hypothetical protein
MGQHLLVREKFCNPAKTKPLAVARPSSSDATIQGYTALWPLITVALNTMAQPAGRVCGQPAVFGFILRASPFIDVSDAISLVLRLSIYRSIDLKLPRCFEIIRDVRFDENPDGDASIRALQQYAALRWFIFVGGTVEMVIKILSSGGIPITSLFTLGYLLPFVVLEAVFLSIPTSPSAHDSRSGENEEIRDGSSRTAQRQGGAGGHRSYADRNEQAMERCRSLDDRLKWMDRVFLAVGTVLHLIFVSWAYDNLWKSVDLRPPNDYTKHTPHELWFVVGVELPLYIGVASTLAALYRVTIFHRCTRLGPEAFIKSKKLIIALSVVVFLLCLGFGAWIQFCKIAIVILALQCVIVSLLYAIYHRRYRSAFLPLTQRPGEQNLDPARVTATVLSLTFFTLSVVVTVLWYYTRFNSVRTRIPEWPKVFG